MDHSSPQAPFPGQDAALLERAIAAALAWRARTGWPQRENLALAAKLLVSLGGPTQPEAAYARWHARFARRLHAALSRRHGPASAGHRLVLCLLLAGAVLRLPGLAGDVRPPGRPP